MSFAFWDRLATVLFFIAASLSGTVGFARAAIEVTNYCSGDRIDYPVALIYGTLADSAATDILCRNLSSDRTTKEISGSAYSGRFKVLAELVEGDNELELVSGAQTCKITLNYRKNENPLFVRVVYMTDSSGATDFQTPRENDPQNFRGKLDTLMKLMQTFTAERMNDLGFGRRTFNLELDGNGNVVVHVFRGQKTAQEYYEMKEGDWYGAIYNETRESLPYESARNLVIPAYTRFNSETKKANGHTALGGGAGLALFGSGNMFTWPDSLAEVVAAMTDSTPIDTENFMDDSVGRTCFWGAASTTIGACLHELGHTFDLPHTNLEHDIMTRGIDRFNRAFVLREAPNRLNPNWYDFRDDQIAVWPPISAYPLAVNRFFARTAPKSTDPKSTDPKSTDPKSTDPKSTDPKATAPKSTDPKAMDPAENRIEIQMDHRTGEISAQSPDGIWYVGCFAGDSRRWFYAPSLNAGTPCSVKLSFDEARKRCPPEAKKFDFLVLDKNGNGKTLSIQLNPEPK